MLTDFDDNNTQSWLPPWVHRASNDEWNFGIILKSGLKIAFSSICAIGSKEEDKDCWLRLNASDKEGDIPLDGCIQLNERGMYVRLSEVAAFWERSTT